MAPPPVIIAGWSSTSKVPGVTAEVVYGAGPINAASIPLVCLLMGLMLSTGSATGNQDVNLITNADSAANYWDGRSEIAQMAYKALAIPGVNLYGLGTIESSGGGVAAATLTITLTLSSGTNPAAIGTLQYWIGGRYVTLSYSVTDTLTTMGANLALAINANPRWPFTAAAVAGVVTVTIGSKGIRGNDYIGFQDTSKTTGTNVVSVITGGASVTAGGVHFTGGSNGATPEAIATCLSVLFPGTYDFIAAAQNDATNAALFLTHSVNKGGPIEMRPTRFVLGQIGSLSSATTLAQTTLNDQRATVAWCLNCESPPSEIAAVAAAMRCQGSQNDPGAGTVFAGAQLPGIAPQRAKSDWAQRATQESALASGVTPLVTVGNGVQFVRAIGTHSLSGSNPDYRTLDWADDYVPDFIRKDLSLFWNTSYVIANPRVADDPDQTQRDRVSGVATPTRWNQTITGRLLGYEARGPVGPLPILVNTTLHPPTTGYDSTAKRLVSVVPLEVMPGNYQCGLSVRQIVPS